MADGPLIGIAMRLERDTRRFYLGRDYSEAVHAAGGVPMHLSLIPDEAHIEAAVAKLDGLLLPGADCDPAPALYGEDPHPNLGTVVPEKDATDLLLIKEAEKRELPMLGICYGMQILNVARGGTLVQDIQSQVPDALEHQQGVPREHGTHEIRIKNGSLLSELVPNGAAVMVNSHHHQSVGLMGRDLRPVAWAPDGVVEAIEDESERFCLGVQWHPELSWAADPFSNLIFRRFLQAASAK